MGRSLRTIVFLSACVSLSLSAVQVEASELSGERQNAAVHVTQGETAAGRGNWTQALKEFTAAINVDPSCAEAFYDLGVAQAHNGNFADAVASERSALSIDPKFVAAYIELGAVLARLHDYDAAAEAERKALELDPGNRVAAKNLEAIEQARAAINPSRSGAFAHPRTASTTVARTTVAAYRAMPEAAAAKKDAAPVSKPAVAAWLANGRSAYRNGSCDVALQTLAKAVQAAPQNAMAHVDYGVALGTVGNYDGEISEEKKALALDARNAAAYSNLGWAQAKKQRWHDSLLSYQQALTIAPTLIEAQIGQALALFYSGKREAGVAAARFAVRNAPQLATPKIALGSMLQEQGRLDEAAAELKAALTIEPANTQAQQQLAGLYIQVGNSAGAVELFEKLIGDLPGSASAHAGLSLALELQGDSGRAETEARKALNLNPKLQLAQATLDRLSRKSSAVK